MKMRSFFKNPEDGSDTDGTDDFGDNVVVELAVVADEVDSDLESYDEEADPDFEPNSNEVSDNQSISSDDSFDPDATDSDDHMSSIGNGQANSNNAPSTSTTSAGVTNNRDLNKECNETERMSQKINSVTGSKCGIITEPSEKNSDSDNYNYSLDSDDDMSDTNNERAKLNSVASTSANNRDTDVDAEAPVSVFDMDEENEDDETVRAIIREIKKPRDAPPEIITDDFITDICFDVEALIIGIATITGDVFLYSYGNENRLLSTLELHGKACRDIEISPYGELLLSCSKDKCIMVTSLEKETLVKFYETAHDEAINKLHIIDENLFASGDDGGTVKLWDLRTKNAVFELKEVEDQITQILTNNDKKLLLTTSSDGYLTTFNIGARKLYVQSEPYEEELNCMGTYRGDSKLVVGTSKGQLYSYNWGQFGYHCDMYPGIKSPINEMLAITDRIACVAGEDGIIYACHIAPFRNLGIVGQHNMPIEALDISPSGELIASSSHNNDVRFWNVKYFEDFGDIKYNDKHNTYKDKRHNLPSSKVKNASDFFADLARTKDDSNE